ncbi:MAG TPA: hypothetical protein VH120_14990 [Gemmataceae bacterium]|jgi:hypothetical protein|nr:hypothetical protein [Gemmataceae bacterium]
MELGRLLRVEVPLNLDHKPAQWAKVRDQVRNAFEHVPVDRK